MTTPAAYTVLVVAAILCVAEASDLRKARTKRDLNPNGLQGSKELDLSGSQKTAFDELRAGVKGIVKFPPMKKDIFLVKFLRVNAYDAKLSIAAVQETVGWRKDNKMDEIATEDLALARKNFDACTTGTDVQGRPVLYMHVGKWALATAIEKKEKKLYMRAFYQLFDEAATKAVETFEGGIYKNAQYVIVLNYDKWTTKEGACPECIAVVTMLAIDFDRQWPDFAHRIVFVNVADDFNLFLDIIRKVLTKETNAKMQTYDRKKSAWCGEVSKFVDVKQLKAECAGV